jgi:hypothetical protein
MMYSSPTAGEVVYNQLRLTSMSSTAETSLSLCSLSTCCIQDGSCPQSVSNIWPSCAHRSASVGFRACITIRYRYRPVSFSFHLAFQYMYRASPETFLHSCYLFSCILLITDFCTVYNHSMLLAKYTVSVRMFVGAKFSSCTAV